MRAVAREAAFEQGECVDREWRRAERAVAGDEVLGVARPAAFPARQRDVGMEGATLGLEADREADPLDFGGERGERRLGLDPGPQSARTALVEPADSLDPQLEARRTDAAERVGEVLGDRALDFTDEAQGQVQ